MTNDTPAHRFRMAVKRNYWLRNLYYLATDIRKERRLRKDIIDTESGTKHGSLILESSLRYISDVFDDYKRYGEVEKFHGKIAEVGAGDNCGIAMLFLNDGCESVDLPDRFYSKRDLSHQAQIYKELWKQYPAIPKILGNPDPTSDDSFRGIHRFHGADASCEQFFNANGAYDYIVSRSVMEHVTDPRKAIESMAAALKPSGRMIHKVDLRDHGMHSDYCHELKFLEAPAWLHSRMTRATGRPNRMLINVYRDTLDSLGIEYHFKITRLAGVGQIKPHRPYEDIPADEREKALAYVKRVRPCLARAFDGISDQDISIAGFFFVAHN